MLRPWDKHLDSDELDQLVSPLVDAATNWRQPPEEALGEAQRHVESCLDCSRKVQMHKAVQNEISGMREPGNFPPREGCAEYGEWIKVAAGVLPQSKSRELITHAAQCGHCGPLLRQAAETLSDEVTADEEELIAELGIAEVERQNKLADMLRSKVQGAQLQAPGKPWWREFSFEWRPVLIAAAFLVTAMVGWIGWRLFRPPKVEQLLAQAYTEHRTLEIRIPGAKFAPMRGERSADHSNLNKPLALLQAESLIGEELTKHPSSAVWLQAKGRADLLDGNYDSAIESLQRVSEINPDTPGLYTDLGSAYYLRAVSTNALQDYGTAINLFGKALAKSPDDPTALFNRALACEQGFCYTQAINDWRHYLRVDPSGEWANEARRRLTALEEKVQRHEQSQVEPLLPPSEIAALTPNDDVTYEKIDRRIEDYSTLATSDWLSRGYPPKPSEEADSRDSRVALKMLAGMLARKHKDRWLTDLLRKSWTANFPAAAAKLSLALKASDAGDNVEARKLAREAEQLFSSDGNQAGALRARVEYMFASHDALESDACLGAANGQESLLRSHSYRWLLIQYYLEKGTCSRLEGNVGEAWRLYQSAATEASSDGYGSIYLRTQDHLANISGATGLLANSLSISCAALRRFWSEAYGAMRGYNLYYDLYEIARLEQQPYLQMAVWRDGIVLSESFTDNTLRAMAHSLMGSAAVAAKETPTAEFEFKLASDLFKQSPQIESTRIARIEAEARLAEVETANGHPELAVKRLQELQPEVSAQADNLLATIYYTALGYAEFRLGADRQAEAALHSAISVSERQLRSLRDARSRREWSHLVATSYQDFAELQMHRGDSLGALATWEWYRASYIPLQTTYGATFWPGTDKKSSIDELKILSSELTKETVVTYALLPKGLAIWIYDDRGTSSSWTEIDPNVVTRRVNQFVSLCADPDSDMSHIRNDAKALYSLFVAPIEQHLSHDRPVIVELDDSLAKLPLDVLIDSYNRYAGDRWTIVYSLGLYYWRRESTAATIGVGNSALIAVEPGSGIATKWGVAPLPDVLPEGAMVARQFKSAHLLVGNQVSLKAVAAELPSVSLFHFAGHAISSAEQSGLLLFDDVLTGSAVEQMSLSRVKLGVLSACYANKRSDANAGEGAGVVGALLRAGVVHVVASRWDVNSAVTRDFMQMFYREVLSGKTVSAALHAAEFSLRSRPGMAHPYYWAGFGAFGQV